MKMNQNLPAITDKNFTSKFFAKLKELGTSGIEGVTGILASDKSDRILTAGRLFQGLINQEFLKILLDEWNNLRRKGCIKDEYQQTEQHHACLQEMLDFIDSDKPDKTRFEFMKKIFLSAATETIEDRNSVLPQQYMFIARKMTSGDALLLTGLYEMYLKKIFNSTYRYAEQWIADAAKNTSFKHEALVVFHEKHLMELCIIDWSRKGSGQNRIERADYNRLTTLALELCEFIKNYDKLIKND